MSFSTWHFITLPPPWDGCLGTWCCRDLCPCDRDYLEEIWLLMIVEQWFRNLYTIGASSLQYFYTTSCSTDLTTSTVPAAHEPVTTFTLMTFNRRPSQSHTSSWRQSLVIPSRSHVSFIRQLSWAGHRLASSFRRPGRTRTAMCTFYVLAAHEPATSAVLLRGAPRHVSPSIWATSSPNNSNLVIYRHAPFQS